MPLIKTGFDPLGVKEPSQSVVTNRRQALVAVWRHLGGEGKPDRQQAEEMIADPDKCVGALGYSPPRIVLARQPRCFTQPW